MPRPTPPPPRRPSPSSSNARGRARPPPRTGATTRRHAPHHPPPPPERRTKAPQQRPQDTDGDGEDKDAQYDGRRFASAEDVAEDNEDDDEDIDREACIKEREAWMNVRVTHRNFRDARSSQRPTEAKRLYKLLEKHCDEFYSAKVRARGRRKALRRIVRAWRLRMEAKFLEAEVVQIIQLRRRQRLFSTMFDGWRRASIKAWEGAAGAGQTPMPEMTHDSMDVGDDESTVAHDNDSHDGGDGDGDSSRGEGSDKEGPSDESTHGAADDTTVVQRTPRQPERRRRSKGGRMGVDGSPMTDSKLQSLEQRMWYQFNEKQRHLKAGHAHRMAKLEQLFQLKKKQAVELALANYRDELQQDTKQAVESMRKREAELFEKEAEEFRASLQSDIDYVQKMASEFELKAERALSSRRQRMVEERRTAVQRLYKQQQAEIAAARERMKVLLQSDMMERSSAKLKTAIAIESERLEEEAESRISELRAQCDAELVRIRSTKPEELWRESTRGQKLAQKHQELLDQLDSERRAWKAELKDLELNQLQQETLTQRLIGQEKLRHVAELETVRQRFRQTTRSLSDGSFVDKMNSAVFRLLEHTDKLSRPRRSKADSRNNSPSTGNPKQVARAELHSPTVTLKGRSSRTSTPSPSKESEDARVSPSWLRIYGGIDDNRRR